MLVIADPQLTDEYSYEQEPGLLLALTELFSDIYMKRNFRLIQQLMRPQFVMFAGDMMDGGREWKDAAFNRELKRLGDVFQRLDSSTVTVGVPGNHDIGFGDNVINYAYERYLLNFGRLNSVFDIGEHFVILLDTVSLSSIRQTPASKRARDFMDSYELPPQRLAGRTILLTHVPLYRPGDVDCGPRRRSPPIANRAGYQYQSETFVPASTISILWLLADAALGRAADLIQPALTQEILKKFRPDIIISGDDHDDCVYSHVIGNHTVVEHTIGTFSWLQGNPYPSFGVMSLRPTFAEPLSPLSPTFELKVCSLPPQMYIYFWYIALLVFSILWIARSSIISPYHFEPVSATDPDDVEIGAAGVSSSLSLLQQHKQPGRPLRRPRSRPALRRTCFLIDGGFWSAFFRGLALMVLPNLAIYIGFLLFYYKPNFSLYY
nr:hypothetical protein HK105_008401 [Polyrhizophydium stewartii]